MRRVIEEHHKDPTVDPFNVRADFYAWRKKAVTVDDKPNPAYFTDISAYHAQFLVRYILDLEVGKNLPRGTKKGPRSFVHLLNNARRLHVIFRYFEQVSGKTKLDVTEDEVIDLFNAMRTGKILSRRGKPYKSTGNYSKVFKSFWRYYMRLQKKQGTPVADVTEDLDTSFDKKPEWNYFTLDAVKKMASLATFEYKALLFFLFDSGIRPPKEMMNVRIKDLTPIPNSPNFTLSVRDDTSKTFGRKIKLMICSQALKEYIESANLKGDDFLFSRNPATYTKAVRKLGYQALGIGEERPVARRGGGKPIINIAKGIKLYDFRHNSVCHYLPIYQGENQLMYRYGWNESKYIRYYSEWMGMRDTLKDEDMLIDTTKTEIEQRLESERKKTEMFKEQIEVQRKELETLKEEITAKRQQDQMMLKVLTSLSKRTDIARILREDNLVEEIG